MSLIDFYLACENQVPVKKQKFPVLTISLLRYILVKDIYFLKKILIYCELNPEIKKNGNIIHKVCSQWWWLFIFESLKYISLIKMLVIQ